MACLGAVELGRQPALGDGHPDGVGEALAERAGRRLDAGRQAVFGVAGRDAAPLAERLEVVERDRVAGQVEERVEQHAGVAGAQHEAVAVGPVGLGRGMAQEARPQHVRHRRRAHRGARVPGVRLLDGVDRERPDRVDGELVEVGGHGSSGGLRRWVRACGSGVPVGRAIVVVARLSSGDASPATSRAPGTPGPPEASRPTAPARPGRPAIGGGPGRPDRRPRRPDARCGACARPASSSPGPTCRDASRSSRVARRPTRPAGSAGSGRGRRSSRRSVATRPGAPSSRRSGPMA